MNDGYFIGRGTKLRLHKTSTGRGRWCYRYPIYLKGSKSLIGHVESSGTGLWTAIDHTAEQTQNYHALAIAALQVYQWWQQAHKTTTTEHTR